MRKSSWRVLEIAMLAAIVCSGTGYAQTGFPNADLGHDRQGDRRDLGQGNRDMRADRQDVRQDEGALRQDRQQLQRVNTLGPAPDNSNRTGKIPGTTVKIFKAIVGIYEAIARTGEEIGMISEQIDRIGIRIGRV